MKMFTIQTTTNLAIHVFAYVGNPYADEFSELLYPNTKVHGLKSRDVF